MQKPSLGRIVIVGNLDPAQNNGATEAPAVITRVWPESPEGVWTINVRVLLDTFSLPPSLTSIRLYNDLDAATPTLAETPAHAAYWPPRV